MSKPSALAILLLLATLTLTGCAEELSNRLPYAGPVEKSMEAGQYLPGTGIQYLAKTEDGALVSIGGQQATKKLGDSLEWKTDMVAGVSVDQTLRIVLITEDTLRAAGTARVIVANPEPSPEPANSAAPVHFKLPVGYHVEKGSVIPGSTITYLGETPDGAELGGIGGYAFRRVGDSITWEGKLRAGVWVKLNLRAMVIRDEQLDVLGTADLWITPVQD
jgi:hypothetical protein